MLVLSRLRDETIMIGDDIEISVVDIRGDKVRIGITAPKEVNIHRKEVYEAIKKENRSVSQIIRNERAKKEEVERQKLEDLRQASHPSPVGASPESV